MYGVSATLASDGHLVVGNPTALDRNGLGSKQIYSGSVGKIDRKNHLLKPVRYQNMIPKSNFTVFFSEKPPGESLTMRRTP